MKPERRETGGATSPGGILHLFYIIIWFRLSVCMYVCLYVCMYVCLSVCHNVVSTLLDNQWTDFQNLNANSSSLMQNRAHYYQIFKSTSGLARKTENDL